MHSISQLQKLAGNTTATMPVLFVGHGSPMNAIDINAFSSTWEQIGLNLPIPVAIVCISAHWQTHGAKVTAMKNPKTIHDFGGFPQALFDVQYPASGSPETADLLIATAIKHHILVDHQWGLDHGTWSILNRLYPLANIPVVQLSLDYTMSPMAHYELAKELSELRKKGILFIGSGNIVHNLREIQWDDIALPWAEEFDSFVKDCIDHRRDLDLVNFEKMGMAAKLSIPTNEHYLPLLYSLGLTNPQDEIQYFNEKVTMGSISMRSFIS
jgi:4,5-DOPA dioxygenase extradiol